MKLIAIHTDKATGRAVSKTEYTGAEITPALEAAAKATGTTRRAVESWLDSGRTLYTEDDQWSTAYHYSN